MNVNNLKALFDQKSGRVGLYLNKYSPEILLGAGIIGLVATIVVASKATLKVHEVIEEQKGVLDAIDITLERAEEVNPEAYTEINATSDKGRLYVQTAVKVAKLYAPTIGVGVLSISAILASHGLMVRRQVALVAAYNLVIEGYRNYRARVLEELGEDKEREFYLGLRETEKTVTEEGPDGKKRKTKTTVLAPSEGPMPSIYARVFDNSNPMFRSDRLLNAAFLTAQERYANDVLLIRGHLFLNEVYERLGFPHTSEGALVGWVLKDPETMEKERRDGYISFGLGERPADREFMRGENNATWLDFNVDGIVYDLI